MAAILKKQEHFEKRKTVLKTKLEIECQSSTSSSSFKIPGQKRFFSFFQNGRQSRDVSNFIFVQAVRPNHKADFNKTFNK